MERRDIVVIGASAGGIAALRDVLNGLDAGIPASIFVVVHLPGGRESALPQVLSRYGDVPVTHPEDGERFKPGHVYLARPDCHMVVADGAIRVTNGPYENHSRPAIDPLFRSAALAYGERVIGILLSGQLDDGASGMVAVRECGGIGIVQNPDDAEFPSMPRAALAQTSVEYSLPAAQIPRLLTQLLGEAPFPPDQPCDRERLRGEVRIATMDVRAAELAPQLGAPSMYGCPDCGGVLWEQHDHDMMRFRCTVGHAFSPETLVEFQSKTVHDALWTALRALEENASASGRIADRFRLRDGERSARAFDARKERMEESASVVRHLLESAPLGELQSDAAPEAPAERKSA